MVCACFFVLVRQFSIEELLFISARAYVASISVILIFNWQDFQNSFDLLNNRWEVRFSPFGLHPNLVGFVYGAGAMVLFFCGIVRFGIVRWVYFLSSIFCVLFIFASQARAGLVALFFGVFVSSIISINLWTQKVKNIVFLTAATMLLIITINFEYFYLILADMLDLESDTRGIDSGGTGRFELWQLGVETFLESGWKFFLGGGMRSSSAEFIGFSTESSYITIFLEFGLIGGVLFLFVVYKNILFIAKSLKNPSKNWFLVLFFILSIFIFTVIQSIFNRYMLAIGNQFSLLFLILNFKIATISYENRAK
jgi:O-antigen ligase